MKTTVYPRIGEKVLWETLPNGLPVCVVPKPGYARRFAFFTTRYGGMDMRFRLDGRWLDTPAGIAHYLEHKMFDLPEGNALNILSLFRTDVPVARGGRQRHAGAGQGRGRAQRLHQQRRHRLLFRLHRAFL